MLEILNELFINYGLFGLFVVMILNTIIFSPPSELVLPLAGLLAYTSGTSLILVILIALFGNLLGTYFWYFIGRYVGYLPILKIKYFKERIKKNTLVALADEFKGKEAYWVGIFRLFPFIRAVVSLPAGMVKMSHRKFLFYSIFGMLIWSSFWILVGYFLGFSFFQYKIYFSIIFLVILVFVSFFFYRKMIKYLKKKHLK